MHGPSVNQNPVKNWYVSKLFIFAAQGLLSQGLTSYMIAVSIIAAEKMYLYALKAHI